MSVRHTRHSTLLLEPDDAVGKHSREATPPPPSPGRMGLLPRSMNNNLGTLAVVLLGATALAYMGGFLEPHTASRTVQLEQLEVALQQQKTLVEECDMRRDEEIRSGTPHTRCTLHTQPSHAVALPRAPAHGQTCGAAARAAARPSACNEQPSAHQLHLSPARPRSKSLAQAAK